MLVLDDADRNPEFDHAPGLSLRAPAGMRLEDGEHLLFMRDRFALQQPPVDLVDLAKRMIHKVLHGIDIPCLRPRRLEFPPQPFRPRHQRPTEPQVSAHAVRMPPLPPGIADLVEQPLHLPPQMPALPPAAKPEASCAESRIRHRIASHGKLTSVG